MVEDPPCKECISFAICNSNEKCISCSMLTKYLDYDVKDRHMRKLNIERLYKRQIQTIDTVFRIDVDRESITIWWVEK